MAYRVQSEQRFAGGGEHTVYRLMDTAGSFAEVWPSMGGNCLRWTVASRKGPMELLYAAPDWEMNPIPTRSGTPVLFPFPNRNRNGRFVWQGRQFQLPINCPQQLHAIHGFACRSPWSVANFDTNANSANLLMVFEPKLNAPHVAALWPGEYRLRLNIEFKPTKLSFIAVVQNMGEEPLPWGLGYHPYFKLTDSGEEVQLAADSYWELDQYLPTGNILAVDANRDLRQPRRITELNCDDLYTNLPIEGADWLVTAGSIYYSNSRRLNLHTSPQFKELVVFNPPHRQAICLEPYTCPTDAMNLTVSGHGMQVLQPGESKHVTFEMQFVETE
jgi:aldose 1-epimerase